MSKLNIQQHASSVSNKNSSEETLPIFIGYTEKFGTNTSQDIGIAEIHSLAEYEEIFGKGFSSPFLLYSTIRLFYANSGKKCLIISVDRYDSATPKILKEVLRSGIDHVEKFDFPTLLIISETVRLNSKDAGEIHRKMLEKAKQLGNCFAILDISDMPDSSDSEEAGNLSSDPVSEFKNQLGIDNLSFGAAYYPWLQTNFQTQHQFLQSQKKFKKQLQSRSSGFLSLPPSAAVAAAIAKTDRKRGIWKTAANIPINEVLKPLKILNDNEIEALNIDTSTGISINAIRFLQEKTLIWGGRTLAGLDNEWRYIAVRRTAEKIKSDLQKRIEIFKNEENNRETWMEIRQNAEVYLDKMWRLGAFAGAKPEQAFFVRAGLGETMTSDDIQNGILIVMFGIAIIRPAEFIIMQFTLTMEQ